MQNWLFDFRSRTFVLLLIGFLIVSLLVYYKISQIFDYFIISLVAESTGNPILDLMMQIITESGDSFYMLGFGILMLVLKKTRRIGITLMILIVLSTLLTGYIKCGVDRERPDFEYTPVPFPVELSRDTYALFCEGGSSASYPSGHSARSIVFGIVLGFALSERFPRGAYLLFLYPFLVSLSRVYVLQHFPMDVVGGTILGIMLTGILAKKTKLYKILKNSEP